MSQAGPVDDPVGDALCTLVRDFGRLIGGEPERVRSFIKDLLGDRGWTYRRNAEAVVQAAAFEVPEILLSGRAESSGASVRDRFRDSGFSSAETDYGIAAWAKALSVEQVPAALMPSSQGGPTAASQAATVLPGSDVTVVPGSDVTVVPAPPPPDTGQRTAPLPGTEIAGTGAPSPRTRPAATRDGAPAATGRTGGASAGPDATVIPAHLARDETQPSDRHARRGSARSGGPPTDPDAAPRPPSPRRKPILIAAAVGVVLLVAGVIAAITLPGGSGGKGHQKTANNSGIPTVRGEGGGLGVANILRGTTTLAVKGATRLQAGDRVRAVSAPVQVDTGAGSVLRLEKGAELVSSAKSGSSASPNSASAPSASSAKAAAEFQVAKGRVYAAVGSGHRLVLHTVGAAQARVGPGRMVVTCGGQCSYQALDETQQVQPQTGSLLTLQAHQRASVNSAGKASVQRILPDVLRGDPFIASNVKLDGKQGLKPAAITGPSVLGPWAMKVVWQDGASANRLILRQLTFSVDCSSGSCGLNVVQTPAPMTCPVHTSCPTVAKVPADGDASATADSDVFALNFGTRPADCSGDGQRDGTLTTTADLTLTGDANGHRTSFRATFHTLFKASGPACDHRYLVPPDYDQAVGKPGKVSTAAVPQPGAEENLLNRNTRTQSTCTRSTTRPAGSTAALSCTTAKGQRDPAKRPATMLVISFSSAAAQRAAYNQQLSAMGGAQNYGTCSNGQPCERPIDGTTGRVSVIAHGGTTNLIAYAPEQSLTLLVAQGFSTTAAAYPWFDTRMDADLPWLPIAHF
jgi:hypothetical protein